MRGWIELKKHEEIGLPVEVTKAPIRRATLCSQCVFEADARWGTDDWIWVNMGVHCAKKLKSVFLSDSSVFPTMLSKKKEEGGASEGDGSPARARSLATKALGSFAIMTALEQYYI